MSPSGALPKSPCPQPPWPPLCLSQPPHQSTPFIVQLPKQTWYVLTSGELAAIDIPFTVTELNGSVTSLSFAAAAASASMGVTKSFHLCMKCLLLCYFLLNWLKWNHMSDAYHRTSYSTNMSVTQDWADGERELASRLFSISWWNVQHGSCSVVFSSYSPVDPAK